jgi:hypothetical protein
MQWLCEFLGSARGIDIIQSGNYPLTLSRWRTDFETPAEIRFHFFGQYGLQRSGILSILVYFPYFLSSPSSSFRWGFYRETYSGGGLRDARHDSYSAALVYTLRELEVCYTLQSQFWR